MEMLRLLFVPTALALLSGCCTAYVHQLGRSVAVVRPERAWRDADGNLVVDIELLRYHRPLTAASTCERRQRILGPRHLVLRAKDVDTQLMSVLKAHRIVADPGRTWQPGPYVLYADLQHPPSAGAAPPSKAAGWFLWPPDALHWLPHVAPPEFVGTPVTIRQPDAGTSLGWREGFVIWHMPDFACELDGVTYGVVVKVSTGSLRAPHFAPAAYPLKILFLPAVVVDAATFPIQAVYGLVMISTLPAGWWSF